jgi:hypothetical protein
MRPTKQRTATIPHTTVRLNSGGACHPRAPWAPFPTMFTFSYPCTATSTALVLAIPIHQRR